MHDIRFPGESDEYRGARNRLLEAEIELRRTLERVASQRRASPPGGLVPEDHVFEEVTSDGGAVLLGALRAGEGHACHLQLHVSALADQHEARADARRPREARGLPQEAQTSWRGPGRSPGRSATETAAARCGGRRGKHESMASRSCSFRSAVSRSARRACLPRGDDTPARSRGQRGGRRRTTTGQRAFAAGGWAFLGSR